MSPGDRKALTWATILSVLFLAPMVARAVSFPPQGTGSGSGSVDPEWTSYTPTCSWSTNVTIDAYYRVNNGRMDLTVQWTLSGNPDAANLSFELPAGYQIDATALAGPQRTTGNVRVQDASPAVWYLGRTFMLASDPDLFQVRHMDVSGTGVGASWVSNTDPITLASGDYVVVEVFALPVVAE